VGTTAGVAVQDLDRDTAKELGVKGKYKVACVPYVVLMDINMPKKNGFEVLEEMKKEPRLQSLPIIMLTMSQREEDVVRSYTNGACSFIHKSAD
jgi:DNA-binding response OmpR family regulator